MRFVVPPSLSSMLLYEWNIDWERFGEDWAKGTRCIAREHAFIRLLLLTWLPSIQSCSLPMCIYFGLRIMVGESLGSIWYSTHVLH